LRRDDVVRFLIGENTDVKIDEITEKYENLRVVDLSNDSEYAELVDELSNLTLFEGFETKILFLKNFDSLKKEKRKELLGMLKALKDEDNLLLFVDSGKRSKEIEGFDSEEITLPKPWKKKEWMKLIEKIFAEKGRKVKKDVLELLYILVGPDLELLKSEIEKLLLFSEGEITVEDVKEVVHKHTFSKLDDLLFFVSEGEPKKVAEIGLEVVMNTPIQLLLYSLREHFITLFRILAKVERKQRYNWVDISRISKELSIPLLRLAGFLGFPLGDRRTKNHLLIYDSSILCDILMRVMKIQREFRTIEYEPRIMVTRLVEIAEYIEERGR